jgi:hypothetical protein
MKRIVLFIAILLSFGLSSYAMKDKPCPPGHQICQDGECHTAKYCNSHGGPPPPGLVLPIDSNIYFLMAAGLGLGIYFLGFTDKKFPTFSAPVE